MRKPVLGVSDQVRHKPGCKTTEDGLRLEILDYSAIYVVKTNGLILVLFFLHMQNSGFLMTQQNFVSNIKIIVLHRIIKLSDTNYYIKTDIIVFLY